MPFGAHIYKYENNEPVKTYTTALKNEIQRAKDHGINMTATQIFAVGPTSPHEIMTADEKKELAKYVRKHGISLVIHGCYFDNPWGPRPTFAVHNIKRELSIANEIGARGVVIHIAKKPVADIIAGLHLLDPWIADKYDRDKNYPRLYLEIEAFRADPYCTYDDPHKLMILFDAMERAGINKHKRISLCVDTAHIHAAGTSIINVDQARKYLEGIAAIKTCPEVIFHLNDQVYEFAAGRDAHAPLTYGTMWRNYNRSAGSEPIEESGLYEFLSYAAAHNSIILLERHNNKPTVDNGGLSNIVSDYMTINAMGFFVDKSAGVSTKIENI